MLTSSSNTSPWTLALGVSSCMRFKQRSRVLLPQPEGPMIAVTVFAGNSSDTSRTARCCPNIAVRCDASSRSRVLAAATIALAGHPAGGEGDHEHEPHEHERGGPGQAMPLFEGTGRIHVDLERQGLHRLGHRKREVQIAQRRKQQGSGFARDARDADETSRHDTGESGSRDDLERSAPARIAERQRRFPQRMRHQPYHLLGRPRQHRNHEDGERHAPREGGETMGRPHDESPGDDPDDDRRRAVQHVRNESHDKPELSRPVLGEIHPGTDADGDADQRCEADDDAGADDRVRDASPGLSRRYGTPGEEGPVDRRRALQHEVAEDEHEREHGAEGERHDQPCHQPTHEMAAERSVVHSALLPMAAPRATRQMRMRAMAFTTTVTTNNTNPTSNSAEWYMFVVASLNSLAMAAAMV